MSGRVAAAVSVISVLFVVSPASYAAETDTAPNVAVAEQFVTAFYSFDSALLSAVLAKAGDSRKDMLFYQGWARGGNYIVMERMPCAEVADDTVRCSITVQDDLVLALGTDFDVTDTFTLTFADGAISAVETSSNDPQRYHDARDWVWAHRAEWVETPCKGSADTAADPGQCVRSMLRGYVDYARLNALEPRAAK